MRMPHIAILLGFALVLAGCADNGLKTVRKPGNGPDEFLVLPSKPLTAPESYTFLPPPTPGGANLTDQNPNADAVAALGGNPAAVASAGSIPSSDAALVTSASRYGVPPDIRVTLAEEDADFRRRRGRLTNIRLFNVDRYADVYRRQAIDPNSELQRYRSAGAVTPTAPPNSGR